MIIGVLLAWELVALASIPSVLLRRQGQPISASAWIFALLMLPGLALFAWWIFGRTRLERRLRKRTLCLGNGRGENRLEELCEPSEFDTLVPERAVCRFAFSTKGNRVELLSDNRRAFSVYEEEIQGAKETIHLFFYTFFVDDTGRRICDRLIERAKEGVSVRVAVDGFGSQGETKKLEKLLKPHGIDVAVFLPRSLHPSKIPRINFTNHRKVTIIDERIAFTGGMNIGDQYKHDWKDLMMRVQGPAVAALSRVFVEDWRFASSKHFPLVEGGGISKFEEDALVTLVASGPDTESWIHDAYFSAITRARERIWITTPYLIPTPELTQALRSAAGRGVDVRLVVPRGSDVEMVSLAARSYYSRLISEDVRIFEYLSTMLHGKAMIVDSKCAVGTANLDNRSMRLSFELCCFIDDSTLLSDLTSWMEGLFEQSEEVTLEHVKQTPTSQRVLQAAAHLFAPLL